MSMRNCLIISTLLCILAGTASAEERIVCLGDSLTAGYGLEPEQAYPSILESLLTERGRAVTVVNAGVSGDTSAGGLRRLGWIMQQEIDVLVIALGANDALRGQPVDSTEGNLRGIIRTAREKQPDITIILAGMRAPPNMGGDYASRYEAIFPKLAAEESVQLLDFLLEDVAARPELNLADGIHPNAKGQRLIAENLAKLVNGENEA
ncbi:MAG: arylesterase [Puniceicoccaceae bacterium]